MARGTCAGSAVANVSFTWILAGRGNVLANAGMAVCRPVAGISN